MGTYTFMNYISQKYDLLTFKTEIIKDDKVSLVIQKLRSVAGPQTYHINFLRQTGFIYQTIVMHYDVTEFMS